MGIDLGDHDLNQRQVLNRLTHPGTSKSYLSFTKIILATVRRMNSNSTRPELQRTEKVWQCEKSSLGWASTEKRDRNTQNNVKE